MNRNPIIVHTTHPTQETVKKVIPTPPKATGETPDQRLKRLMSQAAANRIKVRSIDDWTWQVPSQRKGSDNRPIQYYLVRQYPGLGWSCTCEWSNRQGLYCDENPLACCCHISQCIKHVERDAREIARLAARMTARLAAQQQAEADPTPYVPECGPLSVPTRRDLANAGTAALTNADRPVAFQSAHRDLFGGL